MPGIAHAQFCMKFLVEPLKYFRVVTGRVTEMRFHYIKMFLMLFAKRTKEQEV